VYNWENINSDPTYDSIPNWYFRSWEVNIGIIAGSIPVLRPAWKTAAASIRSYSEKRSSNQISDEPRTSISANDAAAFVKDLVHPSPIASVPWQAAKHTATVEADRTATFGEPDLYMRDLAGDFRPTEQGIKKTIEFEIAGRSDSHSTSPSHDLEKGEVNRDFV
jgi:hypothetical protein